MTQIVLASGSPYRKELLARLRMPFTVAVSDVDETQKPGESPRELCARLAHAKAAHIAQQRPEALVIGSDQVAVCEGTIYGKPGTWELAKQHLRAFSGRTIEFQTAVCLLQRARNFQCSEIVTSRITMRTLSSDEIDRYLALEDARNCAGASRFEGLGISLVARYKGDDPTSLMGLPLLALSRMLRDAGVALP